MYRVSLVGNKYYAKKISDSLEHDPEELDDIFTLVYEGTPVTLAEDLEDLGALGITEVEII